MFAVYKKLLYYVPKQRPLAYIAIGLTVVSTLLNVGAYYYLYEFLKRLVVDGDMGHAQYNAFLVAGLLIGGSLLYFAAVLLTHMLGFRLETNLRKRGIDGLTNASFRYFDLNSSGKTRKLIDDNAAQTHSIVAHLIPDNAGAILTPFLALVVGFLISLRVGIVLLVLFLLSGVLLVLMTGEKKFMEVYQKALETMSSETVEYIRGIQVLKIFGIDATSFKTLHRAIADYARHALNYSMSCRRPYVLFQLILFGFIAVLVSVAALTLNRMQDPAVLAVELIMTLFLGGVMFTAFMKVMYVGMYAFMGTSAVEKLEQVFSDMQKDRLTFGNKSTFKNYDIEFERVSYFSRHDLSDLAQTIMADVAAIEHAMSHAMAKAVGFLFFFPLLSVLLLLGNVKLGLAIILPILLGFGLLLLSKNLQIRESFKHYQKLRDNSESFQEAIENQQEIKSFGLTQKIRQTLYQKMEESEKIHLRAEISAGIPMLCSNVILQFAFVLVILIGVQMLHTGEINILYFLGYVLASIKVRESVEAVSMNVAELYYLDSMVKRIREVRETKIQQGKDQTISSYDIEFDQVSFSYDKDTEVLKNISFTAKQNEVTALVGVSGCGKTSILRLMSRLYDYDGGSIRIGGLDIKEISTKSLFEKIAIVFQDVTLFNASVLENIRIGKKTATDEEVVQAARLANCEEFIRRLPDGYKTMIGENGATLSGGERQRLSIARAFLKDSPIIILDEIAASLDVENEKKIQDSLNRLILDKTVIIISHRLKSVENADRIVVIDCGRVEASGTHLELLKASPTYNNLVEKAKLTEEFQY